MLIKKLTLKNYRNYISECFEYAEGLNIVHGSNAQGKTNSAEAIFMLCTGYSPRARSDKQLIRYGEETSEISAQADSLYGTVAVDMAFFQTGRKRIRINGVSIAKIGEIFGNINSVFFNPGELKLIQESPEDRRRFMDIALSQMNKRYFYALKKYDDVLKRRNKLLKDENRALILDTVKLWDVQLADAAADIITERNRFIAELSPLAENAHGQITGGAEKLAVEGSSKYGDDSEEIKINLAKALDERIERDIILGYTSAGPHRDDLKITLDGEDVRAFGSQGQQRTAALALKLSEVEIFRRRFGEYPLLILDDALSELDPDRQKRLLKLIKPVQTIVTCTKIDREIFGDADFKEFEIRSGAIVR